MSTEKTVHADTRFYYWSTSPRQWGEDYDRLSYVEIDPRVAHGWTDPTPIIWDQQIAHDRRVKYSGSRRGIRHWEWHLRFFAIAATAAL
jgi:hypothetical protein